MQTVLITLTSPGLSTGPFDLYSNADSYAFPFQSGISRASLITGYTSSLVPNGATIIRVKSTGTCTTYVDLSIAAPTTTTTTTTTIACLTVTYGYDEFDTLNACINYNDLPNDYYWNGTTLYSNPGCTGIALIGYYSDGTDVWYWDGTNLFYDSLCPTTSTITFRAKRYGAVSSGVNHVDILISTDFGSTWTSVLDVADTLTTTYAIKGTRNLAVGDTLYVGVRRTSSLNNLSFAIGSGSFDYCGILLPPADPLEPIVGCYDYGVIGLNDTIDINVYTLANNYYNC